MQVLDTVISHGIVFSLINLFFKKTFKNLQIFIIIQVKPSVLFNTGTKMKFTN